MRARGGGGENENTTVEVGKATTGREGGDHRSDIATNISVNKAWVRPGGELPL